MFAFFGQKNNMSVNQNASATKKNIMWFLISSLFFMPSVRVWVSDLVFSVHNLSLSYLLPSPKKLPPRAAYRKMHLHEASEDGSRKK